MKLLEKDEIIAAAESLSVTGSDAPVVGQEKEAKTVGGTPSR